MALKSTICKIDLQVADLDRQYYRDHSLTVARHPSETDERMMMRVLAFADNAHEDLIFAKGLSAGDEPDLWQRDLTGAIEQWIEVGLPDERRVLKACGRAGQVVVYAYGGNNSVLWWKQVGPKLVRARNLAVIRIAAPASKALAQLARRTMRVHATRQDGQLLMTSDDGAVAIDTEILKQPEKR
jgi:uncharacterized protein YaeQ